MGRDKATIEIDGVPLLRRIYNAAAGCQVVGADLMTSTQRRSPAVYIVTPWQERYQSILPIESNLITEQQPHQGPLIAFTQALTEIKSTWVLLLACDLPNLSTPTIQTWIDQLPSMPPESIAFLPKHTPKGWEPLCGFYRSICHHSLREYIHDGGTSFQGWLKMNLVTELIITNPTDIANCNTPADLASIVEHR
jgi:molybdenum cofactor guanylyltransferase